MKTHKKPPNKLLKRERELRCWTHELMADALEQLCQQSHPKRKRRSVVNGSMISRWERGIHPPSAFYQQMLCQLFAKSADALGFVDALPLRETQPLPLLPHMTSVPSNVQQVLPVQLSATQAIDLLCTDEDDATPDQHWAHGWH